jgi:simple sugar transport system permease protein
MGKNASYTILGAILVAACTVFGILSPTRFLSFDHLQSMAFQMPELGLLSLGMMVTILSGGINLSIVANANFFGIITMMVFAAATSGAVGPGWATVLAIGAGTACGLLIGVINGFMVGTIGVSAILATLGTMTLVTGVNVLLTHGYTLSGVPSPFVYLGNGVIFNVPLPLLIFLGCSLVLAFILNRTILGYSIFMLGSNPEATKYGGINNAKVILRTYVLSSVFAVCASIVMMGRFNSTGADYGGSYVLVTVLACVLGGVDPSGGFGKVLGLVIAIVVLGIIGTSLNLIWSDPNLALVIWGAILILYMGIRYAMSSFRAREQGPTARKGDAQPADASPAAE